MMTTESNLMEIVESVYIRVLIKGSSCPVILHNFDLPDNKKFRIDAGPEGF
jgi:hypothetical protein